ncbi:MAG: hypothetical protein K8S87_04310 [Planctomycetes bacterium]|nr:hypothetical protein [Planctomycetota bacterium]
MGVRNKTTDRLWTVSSGFFAPAHLGAIYHSSTANGKQFSIGIMSIASQAFSARFYKLYR